MVGKYYGKTERKERARAEKRKSWRMELLKNRVQEKRSRKFFDEMEGRLKNE